MSEPLKHIERSVPPWVTAGKTVCGRTVRDVAALVTKGEAMALVTKHGKQRAAFLLCMTCATRPTPAFEDDPVECVRDWAARMWGGVGVPRDPIRARERALDVHTLRCLSQLVGAHRVEFDAMLAADDDLRERRQRRGAS